MKRRSIAVLAVVGIWWLRRDHQPPVPHDVQAAVIADGFAAMAGPSDSRRIAEIDRDGVTRSQRTLRLDDDVRLVGTSEGTSVGWRDGSQIALAALDEDGSPLEASRWGKRVTRLCDGAASNEYRFAIGWLESDGRMWMVAGPTARPALAEAEVVVETASDWCAVASAERNVAMLWRENSRTYLNFCGPNSCGGRVLNLPLDRGEKLRGYGCVATSCLFATGDRLVRVTDKGRAISVPFDDSTGAISIVGAGDRAFAIAYLAKDGLPTVRRVTVDGAFTHVWHFAGGPPSLAWAAGKLLVATHDRHYVVDVPR